MKPRETIERFDRYLDERGLNLDAVVIGGVAMALLGVASRQTRDCDVLDPQIPPVVVEAARGFAAAARERGEGLRKTLASQGVDLLEVEVGAPCAEALRFFFQKRLKRRVH